ncbi:MAG: YqiA/YcfP family alpha/beta fold hydrolase [Pseudomonadota bacterium]
MNKKRQRIFYLHGFNSSPDSLKARLFADYCHSRGLTDVSVPSLPYDPDRAMSLLQAAIAPNAAEIALLVGSSLGGYYATYLAERYDLKAALINPAVAPCDSLSEQFLGQHKNMYTGEEYEFTRTHVDFLRTLNVPKISRRENFLLCVQKGDEVLDYRLALELYKDSQQLVEEGGNHSFENFAAVLPRILQFAGFD